MYNELYEETVEYAGQRNNLLDEDEIHQKAKQAIRDGFPAIILHHGHFSVIIGYVQGKDGGLKYVVNDPGTNKLQYVIDV